ncbi:hypothetical protein GTZ89_16960 [Streptomyces sp. SID8382]|uniref:hypothetical protein n=1 Tax=Streptomyces malaysiensis TaxID=92644 RepID=UPI000C2C2561|nr:MULTISPECIES: hypothetical protein [unclassified Streptomyces]AUA16528.1 hypothetical protein CFP59_08719 [Streptomyces sp. M56]MYX57333.1 hypothetical protein [Streptomyces sp. SID8382]
MPVADNGQDSVQSFHWHLFEKSIGHVRTRLCTSRLNGKVELSQRVDSGVFYRLLVEGQVIDDVNLNERLRQKAQGPLS